MKLGEGIAGARSNLELRGRGMDRIGSAGLIPSTLSDLGGTAAALRLLRRRRFAAVCGLDGTKGEKRWGQAGEKTAKGGTPGVRGMGVAIAIRGLNGTKEKKEVGKKVGEKTGKGRRASVMRGH